VVGTSPQFFTACAAFAVGTLKRRPWVFELRDLWPESINALGAMRRSVAMSLLEKLEHFLYQRATRIVAVTQSFKRKLIERGIDGDKIEVVTNGVDLTRFSFRPKDPELTRHLHLEGKFVAGYIGTLGMAHSLQTLMEAASRLRTVPGGADIRLLLLGDGARKTELQERARQLGLDNVLFVDTVCKDEVVRYWSLLDVSVIHLQKIPLFTAVIPSKLFESMGMGIPVLLGVAGESADIVQQESIGEVFEPENVDQLVDGLLRLQANPALRQAYRDKCLANAGHYNRADLALRMLRVLERTAMDHPPRAVNRPPRESG
jgi:glycosyltransferase involved in cell wall biosynthesis